MRFPKDFIMFLIMFNQKLQLFKKLELSTMMHMSACNEKQVHFSPSRVDAEECARV